jgi:hypothetical protein
MNKVWIVQAYSRQAGQTLRQFDLGSTTPTDQPSADRLAELFAQVLNTQQQLNAGDWQGQAVEQSVGVATLDGYLFNDINR